MTSTTGSYRATPPLPVAITCTKPSSVTMGVPPKPTQRGFPCCAWTGSTFAMPAVTSRRYWATNRGHTSPTTCRWRSKCTCNASSPSGCLSKKYLDLLFMTVAGCRICCYGAVVRIDGLNGRDRSASIARVFSTVLHLSSIRAAMGA